VKMNQDVDVTLSSHNQCAPFTLDIDFLVLR